MKNRSKRDNDIFETWEKGKLSFAEMAKMKFPAGLCDKTVKNIIYAGNYKLIDGVKNRNFKGYYIEIYKLYRIKFLELKDVKAAIEFVINNQPDISLSESTIRKIINERLKKATGRLRKDEFNR